ncbi:DUF2163 domain-containing protein [Variovorax ginsengisoli]|uniref:Phage protein (TIGR02218 family) n=1 Tax=Variovorax ginsengisoli TaxID=363844 RepID=A0ABT9SE38_9BURK|nr:DUF2163 domain-containing protein [Variovorax ginsengisoli]MDP9902609.1 putative phage protein (TIGR02218 family) [Variovorax ginsengisoli]
MKSHPALAAWLPTARNVQISEMLTVSLPDGSVWRFATGRDVVDGGATWSSLALLWERTRLKFTAGVEVSSCTVTLYPRSSDRLNAMPVAAAIRAGIWDSAKFVLSRAYFDAFGNLRGILPRFHGSLGKHSMRDGALKFDLRSTAETLNRSVPPVYQAACINTLFDAGCGLNRAAWQVGGNAAAGSTLRTVITGRGEPAGWFTAGVLLWTGGQLAGLRRTVRQHLAGGVVTLFDPLPSAPVAGDSFILTPGCDRTLGAGGCAKFNNRLMYRGTPFIPEPETAL